jgi:hypothetical protein
MKFKSPTSQANKVKDFLSELHEDEIRALDGEHRHALQQFRQAIALLRIYVKQRENGEISAKDKSLIEDIRNFLNEVL